MRITDNTITNTILSNIQLGKQQIDRLQQQASSGLKVNLPGDDPMAAQQVIQLKGVLQDFDQYAANITTGNAWLTQADSAMADMGDVVTRVQEIATQMASGTYNAGDRTNAAKEVAQLKAELIQQGNSQVAGKYIFGGYVSDKPPFDAASGAYSGTDDAINMEVDRGAYVAVNYSGGKLLSGSGGGVDILGEIDKLTTALTTNNVSDIQGSIPTLQAVQNQILVARSDVGACLNRVTSASNKIDAMKVNLNKVLSDKQDADMLQVASDLANKQNAYQFALAASAKTAQLSLLDYLK
jgi:flagellar hook-associated protein 3 FlgL